VLVGLAFVPTKGSACPVSYAERKKLDVALSPGEARVYTIEFLDADFLKYTVCTKVYDVQFVGD